VKPKRIFVLAIAAAMVALVGCSSTSTPASTTTPKASASGTSTSAVVSEAEAAVQKGFGAVALPAGATPVTPVPDKTVGMVVCGPNIACITEQKEAAAAAKVLGYKAIVINSQALTPQDWSSGVETLVNDKVNGILDFNFPDNTVPQALASAKKAGIPVVCVFCGNYLDPPVADGSEYNVDSNYAAQAVLMTDYLIATSDGTAKVLIIRNDIEPPSKVRADAMTASFKTCTKCTIVGEPPIVTSASTTESGEQIMNAALAADPKGALNTVVVPDSLSQGIANALMATGRTDVNIAGYDCDLENLGWISKGGPETVCVNTPLAWGGYAAMDILVRVFAGQHPAKQLFLPFKLVTKAHNLPPAGQFVNEFDFASSYNKLWGK
jgi:ribose transport system substrate-binding protein